jgi:hypothetical protein
MKKLSSKSLIKRKEKWLWMLMIVMKSLKRRVRVNRRQNKRTKNMLKRAYKIIRRVLYIRKKGSLYSQSGTRGISF